MARCPDCNKFVSLEEVEPEVNTLEVDEEGIIEADVRIVNACADCGTELKEYTFDFDGESDDLQSAFEIHKEEMAKTWTTHEPKLLKEGCPEHVEGQPCRTCGWEGELLPPLHTDLIIEEYDPPQETPQFGKIIASIKSSNCTSLIREGNQAELDELKQAKVESKPRLPIRQMPEYEADKTVHELTIEETGSERTDRMEGKGRGARHYYGATINYVVRCSCGEFEFDGTLTDDVQASAMEDLV